MSDKFIKMKSERFINAENAVIVTENGEKLPAIIMSYGDEESEVIDRAICLNDARDIVCEILNCLAIENDPIAIALQTNLNQYLNSINEEEENE
jgi:hypothetical protein